MKINQMKIECGNMMKLKFAHRMQISSFKRKMDQFMTMTPLFKLYKELSSQIIYWVPHPGSGHGKNVVYLIVLLS